MNDDINVVTVGEVGLYTVRYGDLEYNKHFLKRCDRILSVCVKKEKEDDEVIFSTTDYSEVFDFLMKLIFDDETQERRSNKRSTRKVQSK